MKKKPFKIELVNAPKGFTVRYDIIGDKVRFYIISPKWKKLKPIQETKLQELEKRIDVLENERASESRGQPTRTGRTFYTHFNFPGHEFQIGLVNGAKVLQTEGGWYIPWSDSARYVVE